MRFSLLVLCSVLLSSLEPCLAAGLSHDQLKLLQDPQGWEYTAMLDKDNGFPLKHQCFVQGSPHPNECRGTLVFTQDLKFTQKIFVHGAVYQRHGTYELNSGHITFKDELGIKDGPYTLNVNPHAKSMRFSMRQAGVLVGAELLLESEYRKDSSLKTSSPSN